MLAQGRHQTLLAWLAGLPERVVDDNPWLLFWRGSCFLPFDQLNSRLSFEKAFDSFRGGNDTAGLFLSWAGVVDATIFAFDGLKLLDKWIKTLYDLLKEGTRFPSKEVEGRVTFCIFMAMFYRAPQHEDMSKWAEGAYAVFNGVSALRPFWHGWPVCPRGWWTITPGCSSGAARVFCPLISLIAGFLLKKPLILFGEGTIRRVSFLVGPGSWTRLSLPLTALSCLISG